ncbi:transcriptional repressor LexA [Cohnella soli]|uniref:Transcriptional repressor LexA n=1 Tax=Cohnella soli TaxID=425005 RepID=A0ABW0I3Z6_9BACL
MHEINRKIRELRRSRQLTVSKMAELIGVSPGNISDWESDKKKSTPSAKALVAISDTFQVSLDWLMKGESSEISSPLTASNNMLLHSLRGLFGQLTEQDVQLLQNVAAHLASKNPTFPFLYTDNPSPSKPNDAGSNIVKEASLAAEYFVKLPLVGKITAGAPILAQQNIEDHINVPKHMVGYGHHFLLRVQGESMIDKDIRDGDMAVIRQQQDAENGEVVVALIDNEEATLKSLYKEKNHVRLQPANSRMKPLFSKKVQVLGKVVGILRTSE